MVGRISRFFIVYISFLLFIYAVDSVDRVTLPVKKTPNGMYSVKLGLGTPSKTLTFSLLTILSVSWTQCLPCTCYEQIEPIFDPSNSSSYRTVQCTSPLCTTECSDAGCPYSYKDAINSTVDGDLSSDVLSKDSKKVIGDFVFGCGRTNQVGEYGHVAGYFGLGTGPSSFLSLSEDKYKQRFSYCLPLDNSTGFLSLGGDGKGFVSKSPQFVPFSASVPILTNFGRTNYALDIEAILVGGQPLTIRISKSNPLPIMISTGTGITKLPEDIYVELRDEFRKRMSKYPLLTVNDINSSVDTCFDVSADINPAFPRIEFTFGSGFRLPMAESGILFSWNSSVSCFPFGVSINDDLATFGSFQQKTFEIIYDNPNKRIGFGIDGCSGKKSVKNMAVGRLPSIVQTVAALAVNIVLVTLFIF